MLLKKQHKETILKLIPGTYVTSGNKKYYEVITPPKIEKHCILCSLMTVEFNGFEIVQKKSSIVFPVADNYNNHHWNYYDMKIILEEDICNANKKKS